MTEADESTASRYLHKIGSACGHVYKTCPKLGLQPNLGDFYFLAPMFASLISRLASSRNVKAPYDSAFVPIPAFYVPLPFAISVRRLDEPASA